MGCDPMLRYKLLDVVIWTAGAAFGVALVLLARRLGLLG